MNTVFPLRDPHFEARVRNSFAKQGAMGLMHVDMVEVNAGRVLLRFAPRPELSQQHGFVHGGIVASVLDTACGYAASSLMAADVGVLTLEFKINFTAPADGEYFECIGQVRKAGRTISLVDGDAWAIKAGKRQLIATMSASMMTITQRPNIQS